jgi:hypothetical protein
LKTNSFLLKFVTAALRVGLIAGLFAAGWFVYIKIPPSGTTESRIPRATSLQIVLQPGNASGAKDIAVELFPIDIVAVRHEYFAERRAGKRFEDFLKDRMNGRTPVTTRLDAEGKATLVVEQGNWWVHAQLNGQEDLEWRLPISVSEQQQTVELTPQNAYTRAKSF